ncbi:histidinol-phosphate transaminase [Candidatus Soleaferrea massiliensis]|uniref:histidinol-phosphate transaminase n=1 Tax=Candidatus Soleaferrea massiliensis TaxID=1470354 RepID=UPI00058E77AD|nr:histidinol-phosphate transaminase [Candidatus Soleaferrea massiliensis]
MYRLNNKIRNLTPYDPVSGEFAVRLDANESFLDIGKQLCSVVADAVRTVDMNRYPDPYCTELCGAYADYYGLDAGCITVGDGSDELIYLIMNTFLQRGERVLTLLPDFSMYRFYAEMAELQVLSLEKNGDLEIDADAVISFVREQQVKAVVFSNPCNPTSLLLDKESVRKLVRGVDALVVLDEAYMDFCGQEESLLREVQEYDNLIILKTLSKSFGLAALRLGFAAANETVTNALRSVKSPYNVNSVSQAIGCAVLEHGELCRENLDAIRKSTASLYRSMQALQEKYPAIQRIYETRTNFLFIETSCSKELFEGLLERGIVVRHMGTRLRITAGSERENQMLLQAMEEVLSCR